MDLIDRQAALDCFPDWVDRHGDVHAADEDTVYQKIEALPSAQPEQLGTNLAEVGKDCISRQAAIDAIGEVHPLDYNAQAIKTRIEQLPSAQPEIIRCNDCKHWTQTTGNMRGFGLGDCDYIDAKLVNCNGFCYWAERREDG